MSAPFDRKLVGTPFAHAGYMGKVWDQIAWGMTLVIQPLPWRAETAAELTRSERITVAGGVPTQWSKLLDLPDVAGGFPSVRVGIVATAPASPDLITRARRVLGVPLVVRYAMTESPSITGTRPEDPANVQSETVGQPQEGMEIRIVSSSDDRELPRGEVGEVRVRGTCVMRGYWGDEKLTKAAFDHDGWLITRDQGVLDDEGNLRLVGRSGDMYIRGGYNVYPGEVEAVLSKHPAVKEVAVVGLPRPVIGEIGVAFVVPEGDSKVELAELRAWVRGRLADYKAPDELVLMAEFPATPMLKVDKNALRRLAGGLAR